jgi:hypothetical protein
MKKGEIWISVIIYTLVAVLALVLILNTGLPILTEMKDRATVTKTREIMLDLDRHIAGIVSQGEGSQATVAFEIREGEVRFADNQLIWEIETTSRIISPRTSTTIGNLIISSNANVRTYDVGDAYIMSTNMKNEQFSIRIKKLGTSDEWTHYNTSGIIEYIDHNGFRMDGKFNFTLNGNSSSAEGWGYTQMYPEGNNTNLGRAKVIAYMNSDFGSYELEFALESYSDFVSVRIKNFKG